MLFNTLDLLWRFTLIYSTYIYTYFYKAHLALASLFSQILKYRISIEKYVMLIKKNMLNTLGLFATHLNI